MLAWYLVVAGGLLSVVAAGPVAWGDEARIAIAGYDAVAYFTDAKPVPGRTEFEYAWHDARWQFASSAHRDLFIGNPEHYAPQYDGYCAWAYRWKPAIRTRSIPKLGLSSTASSIWPTAASR